MTARKTPCTFVHYCKHCGKDTGSTGPRLSRGKVCRECSLPDAAYRRLVAQSQRDESGCLLVDPKAGAVTKSGYPVRTCLMEGFAAAQGHTAARITWAATFGAIPMGVTVHHACEKSMCIEPSHLELATQRENIGEMHARKSFERRIASLEAEVAVLRSPPQ